MAEELSFVSRPVQLDSYDLDKSFIDLIVGKVEALQIDTVSSYSSEIRLFLKTYIWFHKVYRSGTSIGLESYSLEFVDPQKRPMSLLQRISFLFEPVTSYFLDRFSSKVSHSTEKRLQKLLALIQMFEVLNYIAFLFNGRYRTLLERLFSVQVFGPKKQYSSNWNKTQMILNRELNWRLVSAILTLSLPLLMGNRFVAKNILGPLVGRGSKSKQEENHCQICGQSPVNCVMADDCQHLYCYVCLVQEISQFGAYDCKACQVNVKRMDSLRFSR